MGVASTYLSAVAAGALTAGVAASNVVATPDTTDSAPAVADVGLTAITIPIVDIDQTVGPLTFSRLLALTLGSQPNTLFGTLDSGAGSIWDFPRLATNFTNSSSGEQTLSAIRNPGESIKFGFDSKGPQDSSWSLLGFADGLTNLDRSRALSFTALTGGSEGIGAALGGDLANAEVTREVNVFDSGFATDFKRNVADFAGQLSVIPFNGFKAVGEGTLADVGGGADFKLGSLQVGGGGNGALGGAAGLCLGSAQSTKSCGNNLAFASLNAPLSGAVQIGDPATDDFSVDIPTNLAVAVGDRRLSVTGEVGGVVKVGSVEIGRIVDVDFQIPRASSMLSTSTGRQQLSVRDSFRAIPRKLNSDNESGSTGRHARDVVNSAISEVKTTVNNALNSKPRHAKPDSEE